jgi:predicted nucleotide-binding protein
VSQPPEVDQQLVVHLFASAGGPRAEAGYAALRELWLGCRQFFLMREPIPGVGLPHQMPATYGELPGSAETGEEAPLVAQERADANCQAILRRHHDLLSLSLVVARPMETAPPASGHSWWQDLDSQWSFLSDRFLPNLIGEARIYLARSAAPPGRHLDDLLPAACHVEYWQRSRAAVTGGLTLWEALPWADDRALRRLVLAFDDDEEADRLASSWAWSRGDTAIPPLARYLLHAAKLRFQYRIWQRDANTLKFTAGIRAKVGGLRETPREKLADNSLAEELHRSAREARLMSADLRELRHAAEIAAYNMGLIVSTDGQLAPDGPFADDQNLARSFLALLDDELFYLDIASDRAAEMTDIIVSHEARRVAEPPRSTSAATVNASTGPAVADDITRNVFVVHGRDEQARAALFGFLEALGLRTLGWEVLVAATGSASPYLRDVIVQGIASAQAAVVLLTPDDVVSLHPGLYEEDEDELETRPAMQPRPNVILELGMALATYADRTIVLVAGKHRPMADLGGLNYIRLTDGKECLEKIMRRLLTARCTVSDKPDWRARAWFADLVAYTRKPPQQ